MKPVRLTVIASCLLFACGPSSDSDLPAGSPDAAPLPPEEDPAPADDPAAVCASAHVSVADVIPTVQLLVDRSGTMDQEFGAVSRWDAVRRTLLDDTGLVSQLQDRVRFGLSTYTADAGTPCPLLHTVEPALDNLATMDALYGGLDPLDETPTAPAIDAMRVQLSALDIPGPKAIVLATDGEPDTCAVPDPDGLPEARASAVAAAQAAHDAGIDLFVISVGDDIAASHLQQMANAGAGLPLDGAEAAPYYRALDADDLVAAFAAVIDATRTCSVDLDAAIDPTIAAAGTVTLDGAPLLFGVDWRLADEDTVEILGDACEVVLAGGDHAIDAEFTCPGG
jgi:hypothetical protein